jgi:zinc finger-like protein
VESDLFEQMSDLLNKALQEKGNVPASLRRDLICCTEALQTTLCQHLSKEEQQVRNNFPLIFEDVSWAHSEFQCIGQI